MLLLTCTILLQMCQEINLLNDTEVLFAVIFPRRGFFGGKNLLHLAILYHITPWNF